MVSRPLRFNIYLLLAAVLVALPGCQSPEIKRQKQIAAVRVHLELNPGPPGRGKEISVLRASPMKLEIANDPFLNEIHVESANLTNGPGGFAIVIKFNQKGQWLLEQYTTANPNRRLAIWSEFGVGPDLKDRWLAAPVINRRIKDGFLSFTPDASRDEAEQIVIGLNNYAGSPVPPQLQQPLAK